jgi:hypothetical protein
MVKSRDVVAPASKNEQCLCAGPTSPKTQVYLTDAELTAHNHSKRSIAGGIEMRPFLLAYGMGFERVNSSF